MNAADKLRVKQEERLARRRRERYIEALRLQMSTEGGRLVLWETLSRAGVYSSCFDTQSLRMAAMAGQQAFGQQLLADIVEANEDLYVLMSREARQRQQKDEAEVEAYETDARQRRETED